MLRGPGTAVHGGNAQHGVINVISAPPPGARYRREILAVGGSRPALESFKAFRGREPRPDALLRHSGMVAQE